MHADDTMAMPDESDIAARAIALSDGTYAVPNPTLSSDATVQQRWTRWHYVPQHGWSLAGYGGFPLVTPPAQANALVSFARQRPAAAAHGITTQSDPLPGADQGMVWDAQPEQFVGRNDLVQTSSAPVQQLQSGALTLANNDISYAMTGALSPANAAITGANSARPVNLSYFSDNGHVGGADEQVTEATGWLGVSQLVSPDGRVSDQYVRGLDGSIPQQTLNDFASPPDGTDVVDMTQLNALNNTLWTGDPNRAPDPVPPEAPPIDTDPNASSNSDDPTYLQSGSGNTAASGPTGLDLFNDSEDGGDLED
jgi:hypothetical protein